MPLRKPRDFESLHIQVESDTALKPSEPDQFVSEFKISLLDIDEDGSDVLVGLLGVFKVSREEAGEREIKLFDVCNSHSDELLECYEALFAKGESDCLLNPKAQAILGRPFAPSFVFVDFIAFAPEYRDSKLAATVLKRVAELIAPNVDLIVTIPTSPGVCQGDDSSWTIPEEWEDIGVESTQASWISSIFEQVGDSDVYCTQVESLDS